MFDDVESWMRKNEHKVVWKFFMGKDSEIPSYDEDGNHIWICKHSGYDTLTLETLRKEEFCGTPNFASRRDACSIGGQYEIAVRITASRSDDDMFRYPGYIARGHYLTGFGTAGH